MKFNSYRSTVYGTGGTVATSQPLAAMAGIKILQQGGNAADAAVATAAALNVTEPTSTGMGGDAFALFFNQQQRSVKGINASGRAPAGLTLEKLAEKGYTKETHLPRFSVHTITVPGATAGWVDTVEEFGRLSIKEVLQPAINLAENGYPVAPLTARSWQRGAKIQLGNSPNGGELLIDGEAPKAGQLMKIPTMANTFKKIAEHGKSGFYEGEVAEAIVSIIGEMGGYMTLDDLKKHESTFVEPISVNYKGHEVYEIPPNGQGITALIALNILEDFGLEDYDPHSADYYHILIEAMRLAFADSRTYVADPAIEDIPIEELLSKEYGKSRAKLLDTNRATVDQVAGSPRKQSNTVYLSVVDGDGNACSFINSNYMGFGTGIVPKGTGFTLQNRGHNFSLDPEHYNSLKPGKRPYHTIIPSMITTIGDHGKELYASYGVMGGFMQPQGHVQVGLNLIDHKMTPQQALDYPRFCITDGTAGGTVALEEGIPVKIMADLARRGHPVQPVSGYGRAIFGRGQVIKRDPVSGVLAAGSDPRADGMAIAL